MRHGLVGVEGHPGELPLVELRQGTLASGGTQPDAEVRIGEKPVLGTVG